MAGAGGIEPTLTVLETVVLPLYDAPIMKYVCLNVAHIRRPYLFLCRGTLADLKAFCKRGRMSERSNNI